MQQARMAMWLGMVVVGLVGRWSIAEEPARAAKALDAEGARSSVRLVLPVSIPAVVGVECNVYFDNVVLVARPGGVLFDAVSSPRSQAPAWECPSLKLPLRGISSNSSHQAGALWRLVPKLELGDERNESIFRHHALAARSLSGTTGSRSDSTLSRVSWSIISFNSG